MDVAPEKEDTYMEMIKRNPIKFALSVLALITAMGSAALAFENRYNNYPEIYMIEIGSAANTISDLEDKIFMLNMRIGTRAEQPSDKAMLDRYKSRLKAAQEALQIKQERRKQAWF